MKLTFISVLLLLFFCGNLSAQGPQPVYSFAKIQEPIEWYKQQKNLWTKEIKSNPKNALGWYYLYRCYRNLSRLDTTDTRTFEDKNKEIDALLREMEQHIPATYEFHIIKWMHGGGNSELKNHLLEAEKMGSQRFEHQESSVVDAELSGDIARRNKFLLQMFQSPEYSPGLMYFGYNTLVGLKPGAIIITTGDNDTYPLWMWQAKGFRQDVQVINLFLFQDKNYRDRLLQSLKTRPWNYNLYKDAITPEESKALKEKFNNEIFLLLNENEGRRPLYFTTSVHENYLKSVKDGLYLCGLVYEYSKEPVDYLALLKKNIEKLYLLDYIMHPLYEDFCAEKVAAINENYIVPLFKLWEHYEISGEAQKANELKPLLKFLLQRRPDETAIIQKIGN